MRYKVFVDTNVLLSGIFFDGNESIRRTRDYIKQNYPNAEVNGEKIIFPEQCGEIIRTAIKIGKNF